MMVLVRDGAAANHPVIGIAALSSAAVAVSVRDEWIGWTLEGCLAEIRRRPTAGFAKWLRRVADKVIDELYKVDFFEEEILGPQDLKRPDHQVIARLLEEARKQRGQHHASMESNDYKKSRPAGQSDEDYYAERVRMPLFRSKRALELANMLRVRAVLARFFGKKPTKAGLLKLIETGEGRDAIARVLRKAKADRVGTAMAGLSVCGALPPYNEVLGGKLIALLMTSPQVCAEYRRRYAKTPSVIASSMAGRPITRAAHLVLIGTTSLYGQRPCQYDRIRFQCSNRSQESEVRSQKEEANWIRYEYLGRTLGLGTSHFSRNTVEAIGKVLHQAGRGQQVNYVFGEGVNPRLRMLRDGLTELGLDADEFLRHGRPRIVYGVQLAHNMRPYLLGLENRPKYILPQQDVARTTERMCRWWIERWVVNRLRREDVLERIARHTLVHPIGHGARVILPPDLDQPELFEEWMK